MGCCCSDDYRDMRSGLGKSIGNGLNKKVGKVKCLGNSSRKVKGKGKKYHSHSDGNTYDFDFYDNGYVYDDQNTGGGGYSGGGGDCGGGGGGDCGGGGGGD